MTKIKEALRTFLTEAAQQVREIEASALAALHTDKNEKLYKELMHKKAALLASLAESASAIASDSASHITNTLKQFSNNARTAIKLDSTFYMSALLYPDDYIQGEPNNLEKLIEEISL